MVSKCVLIITLFTIQIQLRSSVSPLSTEHCPTTSVLRSYESRSSTALRSRPVDGIRRPNPWRNLSGLCTSWSDRKPPRIHHGLLRWEASRMSRCWKWWANCPVEFCRRYCGGTCDRGSDFGSGRKRMPPKSFWHTLLRWCMWVECLVQCVVASFRWSCCDWRCLADRDRNGWCCSVDWWNHRRWFRSWNTDNSRQLAHLAQSRQWWPSGWTQHNTLEWHSLAEEPPGQSQLPLYCSILPYLCADNLSLHRSYSPDCLDPSRFHYPDWEWAGQPCSHWDWSFHWSQSPCSIGSVELRGG